MEDLGSIFVLKIEIKNGTTSQDNRLSSGDL
jgi:hypothetical protein